MISVGCVLIPGVYIAIELADTLGKSYIAIIKGDRIQKSVGHIMLLQHDCLIIRVLWYLYSLLHRLVEKRRHVQDIFFVYMYTIYSVAH